MDDLRQIMATSHVDAARYGIHRSVPDGLSILGKGATWQVLRSAEGAVVEQRTFTSENDACVFFLLRALRLFVRRPPAGSSDLGGA